MTVLTNLGLSALILGGIAAIAIVPGSAQRRFGHTAAWRNTIIALKAVGIVFGVGLILLGVMAETNNAMADQRRRNDPYAGRLRRGQPEAGRNGRSPGR